MKMIFSILNQSMSAVYIFTPSLDENRSTTVSVKSGTAYTIRFDKSIKNDIIATNSNGNYFSLLKEGVYHISMHEINGGQLTMLDSNNVNIYKTSKGGAYEAMEFYVAINKASSENDNWFLLTFKPSSDHTFYRDQRHCWLTIAYMGENIA